MPHLQAIDAHAQLIAQIKKLNALYGYGETRGLISRGLFTVEMRIVYDDNQIKGLFLRVYELNTTVGQHSSLDTIASWFQEGLFRLDQMELAMNWVAEKTNEKLANDLRKEIYAELGFLSFEEGVKVLP